MMSFMKMMLLSAVIVCPVSTNGVANASLVDQIATTLVDTTEITPRWVAENTTGWLTDSQGMVRLKIRYHYIDGASPRIYDVIGIADGYYATSGSIEGGSMKMTSYVTSANERSATVRISYRIRNAGISTQYYGTVQFGV